MKMIDQMGTKLSPLVTASLVLTALLSIVNLIPRHQAEAANRAVGVAVEYDVAASLALSQGLTIDAGLQRLMQVGVNMVSLSERTAGDYIGAGQAQIVLQNDASAMILGLPAFTQPIIDAYALRIGTGPITQLDRLRGLPVGLNPSEVATAKQLGLTIIGRYGNPLGGNAKTLKATVDSMKADGVAVYLALGDEVLGNPGFGKAVPQMLVEHGIHYASAEFGKTVGDSVAISTRPDNTIRVHAAQQAELARMTKPAAVERYTKAARERNIRILLVRPLAAAGAEPLTEFAELIRSIRRGLEHDGLSIKTPRPFRAPGSNLLLQFALGLVAIPALVAALVRLSVAFGIRSLIPAIMVGGVLPLLIATPLKEFFTLAVAVLMPLLALSWFFERSDRPVWLSVIGVSAISAVGGLPVAALLIGLPQMLHLDIFMGVKVAVFLPVAVAGVFVIQNMTDWRLALKQPIVWGSALMTLLALGAMAFLIMRTGNDNPAAVSGLELRFRDLLDQVLFVRPRTKEFMIGHPALWVGFALWRHTSSTQWRAVAGSLMVLGVVGQTSIVNTFCHLHTPILLSVSRVLLGLAIGCILGALGWLLLRRFVPQSAMDER